MSHRNPVTWPIIELLDEEFGVPPEPAEPLAAAPPSEAEQLYVASCDVLLQRNGADSFILTLTHRGATSAVKLQAAVDRTGAVKLHALVD